MYNTVLRVAVSEGNADRRPHPAGRLRLFVGGLGAGMLLGAAACAPTAQVLPDGDSPPNDRTLAGDVRVTNATATAPRILMDERFVHTWPDDPQRAAWFDTDGYRVSARVPGQFVAVRAPLADLPQDIVVSATFHKVGGPVGGGYGLMLRDQGVGAGDGLDQRGQYVVAEAGDRGQVGIWRRDVDRWTEVMPWTDSAAVRTDGSPNDLTVHMLGQRLTFVVNGSSVADVDPGLRPGGVGIFVGGDLNEVLVDRFLVQTPGRPDELTAAPRVPPSPQQPQDVPRVEPAVAEAQRVRDLAAGLTEDVGSLVNSFSDGFDSPHSPVNDPVALRQAAARLDAARHKANELLAEMDSVKNGASGGR